MNSVFQDSQLVQRARFIAAILILNATGAAAVAQDVWINPAGGFFDQDSNWADGSAPGSAESVLFDLDATYDVEWDSLTGNTINGELLVRGSDVTLFSDGGPFIHSLDDSGAGTGGLIVTDDGSLSLGRTTAEPLHLNADGFVTISRGGQMNVQFGSILSQTAGTTVSPTLQLASSVSGTGTLNVESGGEVRGFQTIRVGDGSTSNEGFLNVASGGRVSSANLDLRQGEIILNGTGSQLTTSAVLLVGTRQVGNLVVQNGATLVTNGGDPSAAIIGQGSGAAGEVTVTGAGSRWTSDGSIRVGRDSGTGTLNVLSGGTVNTESLSIVSAEDAVNIRGAGSILTAESGFFLGSGQLNVEDGGVFISRADFAQIGFAENGVVNVTGVGSRAEINNFNVGNFALNARLNVLDGGIVTNEVAVLALQSGSAFVTVSGSGSQWNIVDTLLVRSDFSGTSQEAVVTVSDGGLVTAQDVLIGGRETTETGRFGEVAVTGSGSELRAANEIVVGTGWIGRMTIEDGGIATNTAGVIGDQAAASGEVTVTGAGSTWNNSDTLAIGVDGAATLNIADSGLVTVGTTTSIGDRGNVNLTGGRLEFGTMAIENFERVGGTSGSLAGDIFNTAYTDVTPLIGLQNSRLDMTDVMFHNSGTLHGTAALATSLINSGEVQTFAGEQMRFGGSGINQADAEINNFGGLVRFEGSLTNEAGGFIGGRGVFIANGGIENSGVMAFTGTTDVLGDITMQAGSQMVTSGFATTTLFDDVSFSNAGSDPGEIRTSEGSATVILGAISGNMNFTGTGEVFAEGDLRPGNSPGVGTFEGDFFLGDSAGTFIEISGLDLGEFDMFDVAGDFGIGGSLDVSLIDGFTLGFGQEFLIADVEGSMTGMFNGLGEGATVGNFGGQDLFITYNGFSGNAGVGLFTAVPEPSSATLLVVVCGITATLRRKRALRA